MLIKEAIASINKEIGKNITLVAVSKTKPNKDILSAYEAGQRIFGENKVQELVNKYETLPKDIQWHFIGHLQTNKVKYITSFVDLIHGVDSIKLLKEINKRATNDNRKVDCLLQISIANEETKFGFSAKEIANLFESGILNDFSNVNIRGLMGMATNTQDTSKVSAEFAQLKDLFKRSKSLIKAEDFNILSMGMTNDYKLAIEQGSNMIRIGSLIFGERNYP